jgi:hypothetical protein
VDSRSAVFTGVVEEVYPKSFSNYEALWREMYGEELSESEPPSLEHLRNFVLPLWRDVLSRSEKDKILRATSLDELESAVSPFWLTPRRVRLRVTEQFAGPKRSQLVLYTGLGDGDCGVDFKAGERWFVDAFLDKEGRWIATVCSTTKHADKASRDLNAVPDPAQRVDRK